MPDGNVLIEPQLDGKVKVTVTEQAGPAVTVTVSAVLDWRTFCSQAWPVVQSYTPGQATGLTTSSRVPASSAAMRRKRTTVLVAGSRSSRRGWTRPGQNCIRDFFHA